MSIIGNQNYRNTKKIRQTAEASQHEAAAMALRQMELTIDLIEQQEKTNQWLAHIARKMGE